jgi:Ca2+-binding RTX toxin-like protein
MANIFVTTDTSTNAASDHVFDLVAGDTILVAQGVTVAGLGTNSRAISVALAGQTTMTINGHLYGTDHAIFTNSLAQNIMIGATGSVTSVGGNGIFVSNGPGDFATINNAGIVQALVNDAIFVFGEASVLNTGSLLGGDDGIVISGGDLDLINGVGGEITGFAGEGVIIADGAASIINEGTIVGASGVVLIAQSTDGSGVTHQIVNNGTIKGTTRGFVVLASGGGGGTNLSTVRFTNTGVVAAAGLGNAYTGANGGIDQIINAGLLVGGVFLNGGSDQYDGTNGAVTGTVSGGLGDDVLIGGAGVDVLSGDAGLDTLIGGGGDDRLDGGADADVMDGGSGNDTLVVDNPGDEVLELAGGGTDTVLTGVNFALPVDQEIENLRGAAGVGLALAGNQLDNLIVGTNQADELHGFTGNDVLNGGLDMDAMDGGLGDDTFLVDDAGDTVTEAAGEGNDRVVTSVSYTLGAGSEIEVLRARDSFAATAINLVGNEFDQTLLGNAGDNVLNGKGGDDVMRGRSGDDSYLVDSAGDKVLEAAGGGNDKVLASVSYALQANQEIETLRTTAPAGTSAIDLTGNQFGQTLQGNAGDNMLNGMGGNDLMQGLGGDDSYFVDSAGDALAEVIGGGNDRVLTSVSYTLQPGREIELLRTTAPAGTAAIDLTGNQFAQTIQGNAGDNRLDGLGKADLLLGLGGADTFVYADNYRADTAGDYQPGIDAFDLSGVTGLNTYADVQALMSQIGAHVLIDFGAGNTLRILNTTIATLNANQGDFLV